MRLSRFSREELERIGGDGIRRRRWEVPTMMAGAFLLIAGTVFDNPALQTSAVMLLPIALLTNAVDAIRTGVARVRVNFYLARWRHPLLFWFHVVLVTTSGVVLLLAGVQSLLTGKPLTLPRMF